jgi:hypothetical protein
MVWVAWQGRVVNLSHPRVRFEKACDAKRVAVMLLHAQRRRLQAAQDEVGRQGREQGPDRPVQLAHGHQGLPAPEHGAADDVVVPGDVFCQGENHQVGAKCEGIGAEGARDRGVDNQRDAALRSGAGDHRHIGDMEVRIRGYLHKNSAGAAADRGDDRFSRRLGEHHTDTQPREKSFTEEARAPIGLGGHDELVAAAEQGQEHIGHRRHSRRGHDGILSAVESRQLRFESPLSG